MGVIIPAYLPNEYTVLKDTISSYLMMNYKYGKIFIVIVCNGQAPESTFQQDLLVLGNSRDKVSLFTEYLPKSVSKAENVNHGITFLTENIILNPLEKIQYLAIFDADHQPDENSFNLAINILHYNLGYYAPNNIMNEKNERDERNEKTDDLNTNTNPDMVQGRCLIRNNDFISMEMQEIYLIHHWAGSDVRKFSLFGGSNAFWKATVLQEIQMNKSMLTEDIDAGIRAWLKEYKLVFLSRDYLL